MSNKPNSWVVTKDGVYYNFEQVGFATRSGAEHQFLIGGKWFRVSEDVYFAFMKWVDATEVG